MSLAGLVVFARGPRDFLETEGLRKFWIVLACFLFPAVFSLFGAINFERSSQVQSISSLRFCCVGLVTDQARSGRKSSINVSDRRRHDAVGGRRSSQLLTGYSVFGNPLIELDSGQALVTGSLRMGYGSTLAILSFYLEALRSESGVLNSVLALPYLPPL